MSLLLLRPRGVNLTSQRAKNKTEEVMRRIIGRKITKYRRNELMSLGSNYQLCLGQTYGIGYAIHTLRDQNSKNSSGAVLKRFQLAKTRAGIEKHQKNLPISFNSH